MAKKRTMRQLLVECSDPGLVISLAEEFEHVLRHVDFERACALREQLRDLAHELGPDFERVWGGFRLEVSNDGDRPLTFGSRDAVVADEKLLEEFLLQANERGVGQFKLRRTILLPQSGPAPETREQYIRDLADGMSSYRFEELGLFSMPTELPKSMAAHREQLMDNYVGGVLQARARYPEVGHRWVQMSVDQLRKVLEEVNTRAEAVMTYELGRLDPQAVEPGQRIRWAALAARLGTEVKKWYEAVEEPLDYLYQRVMVLHLMWTESRGRRPTRSFLEERMQALIEQAAEVYTADGVAAMQSVYDELCKPPWAGLRVLRAEENAQEGDSEEPGESATDD